MHTHGNGVGVERGLQQVGVEIIRIEVRWDHVRHIGASFKCLRTVLQVMGSPNSLSVPVFEKYEMTIC